MNTDTLLQEKICSILPNLDERPSRLYLASKALALGRGGKQKIATISKVSRMRIDKEIAELREAKIVPTKEKFIRKQEEEGSVKKINYRLVTSTGKYC